MNAPVSNPSGAKTRLFGVALLFIGMLDSLLSWHGGMSPGGFHMLLIAAGLFFLFLGGVARRNANQPKNEVPQ